MAVDIPYDDRFADLRSEPSTPKLAKQFPHYYKRIPLDPDTGEPYTHVDIYQILDMFNVIEPGSQHAIKKIFCAGARGTKSLRQDIEEAIKSLQRQLEILESRELTQEKYPDDQV